MVKNKRDKQIKFAYLADFKLLRLNLTFNTHLR